MFMVFKLFLLVLFKRLFFFLLRVLFFRAWEGVFFDAPLEITPEGTTKIEKDTLPKSMGFSGTPNSGTPLW